ncbi:glyceraldehyde-3-phosphate dehydrogenase, type I [Neorickettsia helminthoeca str. Oregon]|uniref:Glyceraldehyde-3-phosphate dehydrogenase, type I n=1 Tax=Neorickettsia helminthoeca str. Oregon TaxID=1286528 RepID=X5H463_9RICK|nr:type I glyceraldehyde-3-phosphate dehydrogenase [Neorickettsia helminthoeca]AHX11356.1 glyceraldehyde-3-phosphate dehydrogenase, type I [Neorickettsia helminthoeca str. Oregon]
MRVAINGFGRIGRAVLRILMGSNRGDVEIVAVNTPGSIENCVHLLKYDSVYGRFPCAVSYASEDVVLLEGAPVRFSRELDISLLDWGKLNVDLVLECSGVFNSYERASGHLRAGAKFVLVSAPVPDADATIIYGVNQDILKPSDRIISVGSCTTNCLAPLIDVIHKGFGVSSAFMTTIHSYTNDQNVVDNNHKDLRRARACAMSIIPTTTGAAKTIGKIFPELSGKVDGIAMRVPTPNVSMVDLTLNTERDVSVKVVNNAFINAASSYLKGVLSTCDEPLVSVDFNGDPHSAVVDLTGTYVVCNRMLRLGAWYDNEVGFSSRMIDIARMIRQRIY